ncbi:MAG: glycosyltransferase [Bacteroidales bacterium]|nr:glycosyltransferase [Bacteroidales bacterium]
MLELSIVIPFYNAEGCLNRMLESICRSETRYEYEVVLVDDGSTDNSISVAKRFVAEHPNISYYRIRHSGVSCARNIGISKSSGRYICFVDADDCISPYYIEKMLSTALLSAAELVVCGYELRNSNGIRQRALKNNNYNDLSKALWDMESAKRTMIQSVWNKIFVKQIIDENNIVFPENLCIGEDHSFFLDYCLYIKHIKTISDILYIHITHEDSLSNKNYSYDILQERANIIYQKNKLLLSKYPSKQYSNRCSANYVLDIFHSMLQLVAEDCSFKYIKKELDKNKSNLICGYTYNRRQRLPSIVKIALKTDSVIVIYLILRILRCYYKIIGRRFNN